MLQSFLQISRQQQWPLYQQMGCLRQLSGKQQQVCSSQGTMVAVVCLSYCRKHLRNDSSQAATREQQHDGSTDIGETGAAQLQMAWLAS
jgi:hypothetical protein